MNADSLLPVVLPADAARPFRRAAGFLFVAIMLPLAAALLAQILNVDDDALARFIALPAIGLAIIAAVHMFAGLMIWLGTPKGAR
jgi:hypothetical protein